jgi:hypothetical protein
MRVLLTLSGLMLLCASVVTGAVTLIGPAQTRVDVHALSEPAGLVVLGAGFVLLAAQVRRKKI